MNFESVFFKPVRLFLGCPGFCWFCHRHHSVSSILQIFHTLIDQGIIYLSETNCRSHISRITVMSTRVIPCNNCDEDMSADHICSAHTCGGCDEVFSSEQELTDHQRTVHPNMCHACFKFFVDHNSFLAHFRQEHMDY